MIARTVAAIRNRFYRRQRDHDIQILWPAIKARAGGDLNKARDAFMYHCLTDSAWRILGEDKIAEYVTTLD